MKNLIITLLTIIPMLATSQICDCVCDELINVFLPSQPNGAEVICGSNSDLNGVQDCAPADDGCVVNLYTMFGVSNTYDGIWTVSPSYPIINGTNIETSAMSGLYTFNFEVTCLHCQWDQDYQLEVIDIIDNQSISFCSDDDTDYDLNLEFSGDLSDYTITTFFLCTDTSNSLSFDSFNPSNLGAGLYTFSIKYIGDDITSTPCLVHGCRAFFQIEILDVPIYGVYGGDISSCNSPGSFDLMDFIDGEDGVYGTWYNNHTDCDDPGTPISGTSVNIDGTGIYNYTYLYTNSCTGVQECIYATYYVIGELSEIDQITIDGTGLDGLQVAEWCEGTTGEICLEMSFDNYLADLQTQIEPIGSNTYFGPADVNVQIIPTNIPGVSSSNQGGEVTGNGNNLSYKYCIYDISLLPAGDYFIEYSIETHSSAGLTCDSYYSQNFDILDCCEEDLVPQVELGVVQVECGSDDFVSVTPNIQFEVTVNDPCCLPLDLSGFYSFDIISSTNSNFNGVGASSLGFNETINSVGSHTFDMIQNDGEIANLNLECSESNGGDVLTIEYDFFLLNTNSDNCTFNTNALNGTTQYTLSQSEWDECCGCSVEMPQFAGSDYDDTIVGTVGQGDEYTVWLRPNAQAKRMYVEIGGTIVWDSGCISENSDCFDCIPNYSCVDYFLCGLDGQTIALDVGTGLVDGSVTSSAGASQCGCTVGDPTNCNFARVVGTINTTTSQFGQDVRVVVEDCPCGTSGNAGLFWSIQCN